MPSPNPPFLQASQDDNEPVLGDMTALPSEKEPVPSSSPSKHSTPLAPLRPATTRQSTSSAIEAAQILANFATHPANPRNWPKAAKWRVTFTVAVTGFIATCGSSIGVPGVHAVTSDFGVENPKVGVLITTFYVLGLGAGPFLFAPISELYGRQVAYLSSQICFLFFCIGTALSQNMTSVIVLRFFCGVFASSGPALGVATCADVWAPEERGRPLSLYAIGPMAGPVLGSMLGYWILHGGWRWLFWTVTIFAAANTTLFILSASETNAEVIEKKLKYRIHHPISPPKTLADRLSPSRWIHDLGWMSAMVSRRDARAVFGRTFSRPFRLLFFNPVCAIFCVYYAYIYACIYLFLVSIPLLFGSQPYSRPGLFSYEWPTSTVSLAYIGMAIGFGFAATIASTMQDRIYRYLKKKNGGQGQPEYRLVMTQTGMIIMPIGLLIFGWTARAQTHWIGPQIGQLFVALGLMLAFNSIQNFLVDAFFPYSAAAIASATACRSAVTAILPVFAADMFTELGWGLGGTLLAGIALVAVPAPLIVGYIESIFDENAKLIAQMFRCGRQLRERYKFEG